MNIKILKMAFAGLVLGVSGFANAGLITTTFSSNNQFAGNMFNLTTFSNSLFLTGADLNLNSIGADALVSVFSRVGGYAGFETDAGAWVLQGQEVVTSNGPDVATFFDFKDFSLTANTLYGMYFTVSDYSTSGVNMRYTNGNNTYSNANLQLDLGVGTSETDFVGPVLSPRTWNGALYYSTTAEVSEPSIFVIFALGIVGLVARRLKK